MVRNAAIGFAAFVAGFLTAYLLSHSILSHSATSLPAAPIDQVSIRFDALDEALATLDRTLRSEASRTDVGLLGLTSVEAYGNSLEQEIVLMREELHGILVALEASQGFEPAALDRQDPHGSAATYEAQQRSWDVLNGALESQRWTQEDTRDLVMSWTELSPTQRHELLGTLSGAANRGEIEMDGANGFF